MGEVGEQERVEIGELGTSMEKKLSIEKESVLSKSLAYLWARSKVSD